MNRAYIYLAKELIKKAIQELILEYPKLSFMSGFVGSLISIIVSPIVAKLISKGVLHIDLMFIDKVVERDGEKFKDFFYKLRSVDANTITKEQEDELLNKAKAISKRHLSIKHHLK